MIIELFKGPLDALLEVSFKLNLVCINELLISQVLVFLPVKHLLDQSINLQCIKVRLVN